MFLFPDSKSFDLLYADCLFPSPVIRTFARVTASSSRIHTSKIFAKPHKCHSRSQICAYDFLGSIFCISNHLHMFLFKKFKMQREFSVELTHWLMPSDAFRRHYVPFESRGCHPAPFDPTWCHSTAKDASLSYSTPHDAIRRFMSPLDTSLPHLTRSGDVRVWRMLYMRFLLTTLTRGRHVTAQDAIKR